MPMMSWRISSCGFATISITKFHRGTARKRTKKISNMILLIVRHGMTRGTTFVVEICVAMTYLVRNRRICKVLLSDEIPACNCIERVTHR